MADEYDPTEPPTFNAADDNESYDPAEYGSYDQDNAADADEDADEDEDYDPSSFNFGDGTDAEANSAETAAGVSTQREQSPSSKPEPPVKQQQKVVAGFIVEESDDEEDASAPTPPLQQNGSAGVQSGLDAMAQTETQDVSLSSAPQDTGAASTSLNGSTAVQVPASTSSPVLASSLQPSAPEQGKAVSPVASAPPSIAPTPQPPATQVAPAPVQTPSQTNGTLPQKPQPPTRLPHDKVGLLEDRIKDDPKGDTAAWLALIDHYYDKGQYDYAREVYTRFFKVFPSAVSMWLRYLQMERELDEKDRIPLILHECLMQFPSVHLWKFYLDHVRRALPLLNDSDGHNRGEITKAFELTLDHIGIDPDSGLIWREYVDFIKDGPGAVGGSSWQDLQKVDLLRKVYQRAIKLPHSESIKLWKEYEAFEMGLHKATGRKHIQEQSPHYIEARKARTQLEGKLEGLDRSSLPRLPPIYGYAGEEEFGTQVEKYRGWIEWERDEDPLVYKGSDNNAWQKRVLYAYTQATISLCFYPQIWFDAAAWCFAQETEPETMSAEGEKFLQKGITANPESVLLAMMQADRVESNLESGNTDEVLLRNGEKLDVPYEKVHAALYALRTKMQERDKKAISEVQQYYASLPPEEETFHVAEDEDDDEPRDKPKTRNEQMKDQVDVIKAAAAAQLETLKRTVSYVWVAKMRAFRRIQGQGKPQKKGESATREVKGCRGIFSDARPRGLLTSDVYAASALLEWHCYRDASAKRIFDRGLKLFPLDENFVLESIKHLIDISDITNARADFEKYLTRIAATKDLTDDQKREKCRPLVTFMHDWESKYGDLGQIHKIEKKMKEMFPDEPEIGRISQRFALPTFDAIHAQLLLSPTQAQPRSEIPQVNAPQQAMPSVEELRSPKGPEILLGPNGPYIASPKRPLEDSDADTPQRKYMRAESPLKGAAGVRMQVKTATGGATGGGGAGFATKTFVPAHIAAAQGGPTPLPPAIELMLRGLPPGHSYNGARFDPARLMAFLPGVDVDRARALHSVGQLQRH